MSAEAGLTERLAAVLADHHWSAEVSPPEGVDPYLWCVCGWRSDDATTAHWASFEHARLANAHVAAALAPLVAEEVAAAEVRALRKLQRRLYDECETAGWDPDKRNSFAEECAHLHEEVSEAFREWRLHKDFEVRHENGGKPTGIPIELADVLIGLFYNAELHGFDLMAAVEVKHQYNLTRSYAAEGRRLFDTRADRIATTDGGGDRG